MKEFNNDTLLGFSEVDITPKEPVEMIGFDRKSNLSKGILHNLLAQIILFQTERKGICIITIDSLGFTVEITNSLRDAVSKKLNTSRDKVMVCFSHTHAAPNAAVEKEYFEYLHEQILQGVEHAVRSLKPIKAAWGIAKADIGINRRSSKGAVDRRISILKITDPVTNKLRLLLMRVTAHANVLTSDNYSISSDYFGVTRTLLEKEYGCKVVLTQGASGNIRPKFQQSNAEFLEIHSREASMVDVDPSVQRKYFQESMDALNKMAVEIRDSIKMVVNELVPQSVHTIDMFSVMEKFSSDVPCAQKAMEIAEEAMSKANIDGTNWLHEVQRLRTGGIQKQYTNVEIQYFCLNEGCWCGVPNEIMCEIALGASKKANDNFLHFAGYTNGCNSYLPTAEEFRKGGFEVLWSFLLYFQYHGRVMPFEETTAEKLSGIVSATWLDYKSHTAKREEAG